MRGRPVRRGDIFKIVGLAAFVGIISLVSWLVWPYIHMMFEPGGIDQVIDSVRDVGPMGFLILLALQFLQIVVAFIPGMPKDIFTYLVPLTDMRMRTFLLLSNIGRIPGILVSTYAASGLVDGNVWQSIVILAVLAVVAVVCVIFREQLMGVVEKLGKKR